MKFYNTVEYWNKRENPNSNNPDHRKTEEHIMFVKSNINEDDKILDFGPGVGRTIAAYKKNKNISGYDISSKYKERLLNAAKNNDVSIDLIIDKTTPTKFSFKENEFDVAVSVSVLLHQRPQDIENIMCELARVAKKVVIITWHSLDTPYHAFSPDTDYKIYCFNHDYKNICKKNNLKIHSWEYDDIATQAYFVYGKE